LAFADGTGWVASYYGPGGYVFEYHSIATYNSAIVNGDPESNSGVGGHPYAVSDDYIASYESVPAAVDVM